MVYENELFEEQITGDIFEESNISPFDLVELKNVLLSSINHMLDTGVVQEEFYFKDFGEFVINIFTVTTRSGLNVNYDVSIKKYFHTENNPIVVRSSITIPSDISKLKAFEQHGEQLIDMFIRAYSQRFDEE